MRKIGRIENNALGTSSIGVYADEYGIYFRKESEDGPKSVYLFVPCMKFDRFGDLVRDAMTANENIREREVRA